MEVSRKAIALGWPQVWLGSKRISRKDWGCRRAEELFFLLMNHPAGLTKDALLEHLFPDAYGDAGDGLFHSTLYRCRKALGREVILWEDGIYSVKDRVRWSYDIVDFEALTQQGRRAAEGAAEAERVYRNAIQLYRGDYLKGWSSEWCEPTRVRLRGLYVEAAVAVGRYCAGRALLKEALDFYQLAIAKDYYSEFAHRGVMDCLLASGDRLAALRHYRELVERLQEDFPPGVGSEISALVEDMLGWSPRSLLSVRGPDDDKRGRLLQLGSSGRGS